MTEDDFAIASKVAQSALGRPCRLARISGPGSCNRVFRADTETESIIVRLNQDRDHREFFKETWCMTRATSAGVQVPRAIGDGVLDGWNYGIQSFEGLLSGIQCLDELSVWAFLGRSAAKLHKVPGQGFGERLVDTDRGRFQGRWQDYLEDNLRALSKDPTIAGLSKEQSTDLLNRINALAIAQLQIGLCHGDLAPRNVVLDGDRMTLIDWGCAHAHVVPHFDFRELLRDHAADSRAAQAFRQGYGAEIDWAVLQQEIESVLLLCAFDLIRWAQDRAADQLETKKASFQALYERFQSA